MATPNPTAEQIAAKQAAEAEASRKALEDEAAKQKAVADARAAEQPAVAKTKRIRVKATGRGHFGGRVIEVGEIFEVGDDIEVGGWMQPLDAADAKRLAPKLERIRGQVPPKAGPNVDPTPVYKRR